MNTKSKIFSSIAILGSVIFAMVLTAGNGFFETLGIFNKGTTGSTNYNVVLDKNNAYSGGNTKVISTSFGKNPIIFDYSDGCSSFSDSHVRLAADATIGNYYKANSSSSGVEWNNKLSSIESIKPVFNADTGASLQFRASYDGKTPGTWGDFAPLTSNAAFTLASKPYYIELKAVGGSITLTSCEICYSCIENPSPTGKPSYETKATVNSGTKKTYSVDDSFDSLIGSSTKSRAVTISDSFEVVETLSDGSTKTLSKNEFTYMVNNPSGTQIDTSKSFGTTGTYTAFIKVGNLPEVAYEFDVAERLVEEIIIPATKSMNTGASDSISITSITPSNAHNKVVTWASSDTNVATINSSTGAISAIKVGTTIITATATDGSSVVSNNCILTVSNILVTSVSLDKHSLTLYVGDEDVTLTATVLPENATNKSVAWSSNNQSAVTVTNGVIHAVAPGEARIRVSAGSNTEIYDDCNVIVKSSSDKPKYFKFNFYNEEALRETSGTAFTTAYAIEKLSCSDSSIDVEDALLSTSITNTAQYDKNGGLTFGSGGNNATYGGATFTFDPDYAFNKIEIVAALYDDNQVIELYDDNGEVTVTGSMNARYTTLADCTNTLVFDDLGGISSFTVYSSSKRATIYTITLYFGTQEVIPVESISVSLDSSSIYVGNSTGANAVITPDDADNQNVEWSSSNEDVATVNNKGVVTGVSQGTANIIATSAENSTISAYAIITVSPKPIVHVTNLSVTPDTLDLSPGRTADLSVEIEPSDADNQSVTWTGSANGITVDNNGHISVSDSATIGATATITARSDDTSSAYDTCVVTVVEEALSGTATIVPSDLLTSYPTSEDEFEKDGITFAAYYAANMSGNGYLQFKKASGYIANKTAINGLQSITLNKSSHSTNNKFTGVLEYGSEYGSTLEHAFSDNVTEGNTYTFPSGTSYFRLSTGTNNAGYLGSINLTYNTKKVNPTAISIPSTAQVGIGSSTKLDAIFTPSDANMHTDIEWSSSKTSVATVDQNGNVSGVSAGTATITARLKDDGYRSIYAECTVTVTTIAVTSVSLDKTSANISLGGSTTLTATVLPSNATNKSVTWNSSNTSVATVSNGTVTAVSPGTTTITVTTTDGNKSATCSVTVSEIQKDKWTILIYMCGSDLESGSNGGSGGYATGDITEILSVKNQPSDVNIAIQTGGASSWKKYSISNQYNQRYHVQNKQLVKDSDQVYDSYRSMGESNTLRDFITWGLETYPADKTGLILWNHGGALRGVCYDEKKNDDNLTDNEVRTAVSSALNNTGTSGKLEFIGYDACLMGVQDIADFNAPYFNYMVCSEESEAGDGWDYDTWLDDVYSNQSTTTILKAICDGFIKDNGGVNASGNNWQGDERVYYEPANQTLSYLNLAYAEAYREAFEAMATQLKTKITSGNAASFRENIIGKTYCFCYDYENNDPYLDYYGLIDIQHFLELLSANSTFNPGSTYINNALTALHNLVAYSTSQQEAAHDAHGLALYFVGGTKYNNKDYITTTYSNFTNWNYINNNYGGSVKYSYKY